MKLYKSIVLLLSMVYTGFLFGGPEEDFIKANRLYSQAEYDDAITQYLSILENGYESKALYFNLGNSYFANSDYPKAILFFEKAAKIVPNDQSVQNNLSIAKGMINSDIGEIPEFFLKTYWHGFAKIMNSRNWGLGSIFILALLAICIGVWLFNKTHIWKKRAFLTAWVIAGIFVCFILLGVTKFQLERNAQYAIVLQESTKLMQSPDARSLFILPLKAGEKIKILDQIEDWYKVELLDKETGWIEVQTVEQI